MRDVLAADRVELERLRAEVHALQADMTRMLVASGLGDTLTGDAELVFAGGAAKVHPAGGIVVDENAAVQVIRSQEETYEPGQSTPAAGYGLLTVQGPDWTMTGVFDLATWAITGGLTGLLTLTGNEGGLALPASIEIGPGTLGDGINVAPGLRFYNDATAALYAAAADEGRAWWYTTDKRLRLYDGTTQRNVAWTSDIVSGSSPMAINIYGTPSYFGTPTDKTFSANTTLTEKVNVFKNLTLSSSAVLTCLAGGTIIIVTETLTLGAGCVIDANGLGGRGGAGGAAGAGVGGLGGGAFGPNIVLTRSSGAYETSTTPDWRIPKAQSLMAAGGVGGHSAGAATAGSAGPFASPIHGAAPGDYSEFVFASALAELIMERPSDDATPGGIGGGGGGGGGDGGGAGAGGVAGAIGGQGSTAAATSGGGGGGSGFGGGGGGGGSTGTTGTPGAGGRGGGVVLIRCKTINNGGTIRANGNAGGAATGIAGAGGGGGGGAVAVLYEETTGSGVGTLQANGGAAGTIGTGTAAAAGGAGLARSARVRLWS